MKADMTSRSKRPTTASNVVFGLIGLLLCVSCARARWHPGAALAQELLQNGGFEDGAASWSGCGGVSVVDRQDDGHDRGDGAHRPVRGDASAGLSDDSCGSLPSAQFVLVQPVAIPADATDLTLSFWFSRLGPDLTPDGN